MNTVVLFVPQQEAWVVERMGRFHRILEPGLNFLIPLLDRIRYVQSLKEIVINVPEQSAITHDNVTLQIDGVLYLRIMDPYKASYGVEDPEYAVTQLAQTTMRSELGKLSLDKVFRERESLNASIVYAINQASDYWGIRCLRYEIKDIHVPPRVKESMQMQVEAERRKRATVLESEGIRESAINVAEGKKQAQILASEAEKTERINQASGTQSAGTAPKSSSFLLPCAVPISGTGGPEALGGPGGQAQTLEVLTSAAGPGTSAKGSFQATWAKGVLCSVHGRPRPAPSPSLPPLFSGGGRSCDLSPPSPCKKGPFGARHLGGRPPQT
uniref:Stomatin-like protein 2, mitochondrial n=1 Tax=Laticauda laticaudata TaxID=8630 RepID=A0A8C5S0P2_LATLA